MAVGARERGNRGERGEQNKSGNQLRERERSCGVPVVSFLSPPVLHGLLWSKPL
jgi:hypothetical protein